LKVLHFYRTYFPDTQGGLEETIRQICLNTQRHGVESRVLTLMTKPGPEIVECAEATVIRCPQSIEIASNSMGLGLFRKYRELMQWADLVHLHFPWPFGDLVHLANGAPKPSVVTYHSDIVRQRWLRKLYAPLMNRFLDSASTIVPTSPNYFATSPTLGKYSEKINIIPIGIDEDSYPKIDDEQLQATRNVYGEHFFLFVGVLRYYKGLHILLEAARNAPYRIVIVGSGPTEAELKRQANALGLTNVIFTGFVPDQTKVALFKLARGVVFPSYLRSEAFGVTLLEGAMMGKPLISTEIGTGTSHINIDGETGLVIPPANSAALRQAMDYLHYRPLEAEKLGQHARARFEKYFTGKVMGKQYADIYRRLTLECVPANEPSTIK
jgi:rhamnosyl/mannosyltransferase